MRARRWRAIGVLALASACSGERADARHPVPGDDGPRVQVEVLNGTDIDGLARRVTQHLRRHGLDVVSFGSAPATDSTRILIRRGDSTAARRVREALGVGRIEAAPDPRLLLDVSVLLGPDAALLDSHP